MIKSISIIVSLVVIVTGMAFASGHEIIKKADDVNVILQFDNNPPVVGKNNVTIAIVDRQGRNVTDADVKIYYLMPVMPAMNYTSKAELKGDTYASVIDLLMAGQWQADIKFATKAGRTGMVTIFLDLK